jgi:hypothetical protein
VQKNLLFHEKPVSIVLSKSAEQKSRELEASVLIEVQIYFSCVLVKRVAIYSDTKQEGVWQLDAEHFSSILQQSQQLTDKLYVRFNTVMTKVCPVADYIGAPPVTDFKIHREQAFVPKWLKIDFVDGKWFGDYGWESSDRDDSNTVQIRGG